MKLTIVICLHLLLKVKRIPVFVQCRRQQQTLLSAVAVASGNIRFFIFRIGVAQATATLVIVSS